MRVADSDREQVAQLLHKAMEAGRLSAAELESGLDLVYSAKIFAELEPPVVDLPAPASAHAERRDEGALGPRRSFAIMSGVTRLLDGAVLAEHDSRAFGGASASTCDGLSSSAVSV